MRETGPVNPCLFGGQALSTPRTPLPLASWEISKRVLYRTRSNLTPLWGYARVREESQADRVTAAAAQAIGTPGRKVRAPLGRVLGNSQASVVAQLPQGTESGTETYRPDLSG